MVVPVVAAVLEAVLVWLAVAYLGARSHSARAVLNRLERAGGRWSVDTGRFTETWNPAGDAGGRVTGKGRATYWVDESGLINLLFEPPAGQSRQLTGPRPVLPHRKHARAMLALSIAVALAGIAVGATLGYQRSGTGTADRLNGATFGGLAGLLVAWVDWPVIAALAVRRARAC